MRFKNFAAFTVAALSTVAVSSAAHAATRKVCYEFLFNDQRFDCPVTGDPGVRQACQQKYMNFVTAADGDYSNPVGSYIELWDDDVNSNDEYIGTWVIGGTGQRCVTFEWEGAAYSKGEANPDIYLKWKSKSRAPGGGPSVQAEQTNGTDYGDVSFSLSPFSNCAAGATCTFSGYHVVSDDALTERGGRAQILNSAAHMLTVYYTIMDNEPIEVAWPASGSSAQNRYQFQIEGDSGAGGPGNENRALMGQSTAHELGHLLQMQMFEQDDLINDCSLGGSGHSISGTEFESCATTEGWAGYVAAVSFWDPANALAAPSRMGFDYVDAAPADATCSNNAAIEGMVTRSFWDLDDGTSEAAIAPAVTSDNLNATSTFIAQGWDVFASGTADNQDFEGNNGDVHGVNLWDYYDNNTGRFVASKLRDTLLEHNCMEDQATN
jgi:hypothetical protein